MVVFYLPMEQQRVSSAGEEYSVRYCYYFSLFWLHNQLILVSLCFMYNDDDDVPVFHDFIRFHYQYPAFPTALSL